MDLLQLFVPDPAVIIIGLLFALGLYGLVSFFIGTGDDSKKADKHFVGYKPVEAVAVTIATYFVGQTVGAIVLFAALMATGRTEAQVNAMLENPSALTQFGFILAIEIITLGMLWVFLKKRRTSWSTIGWLKPKPVHAIYALLGGVAYYAIYLVVVYALSTLFPGLDLEAEQELGFDTAIQGVALVLVFISLVILPPLAEEIVFRGFLFTGLRKVLPFASTTLIVSALFGAPHLLGGADVDFLWVAAIDTFILSLVLTYLREKTGNLWPSIGLHAIKNGVAFLLLFVFKVV